MNSSGFSSASVLVRVLQRVLERTQPAAGNATTPSRLDLPPTGDRCVWQQAEALAGPQVGLLAAREFHLGDIDPRGQLLHATANLQEAIELATRHLRLICDSVAVTSNPKERTIVLGFRPHADEAIPNSLVEFAVAALCRLVRFAFGEFPVDEVRFRHVSRCPRAALEGTFDCLVTQGARDTAVVVRGAVPVLRDPAIDLLVDGPVPEPTQPLRALQDLSSQVYARLANESPLRETGATDIARELQMSERTLRRRLSEEGTSHRHLLENVRREVALRLLGEQRLSIDEVAYRLGYAQSSSFQRAFKRWTGMPPATYRVRCGRASTLPPPPK